jgi:hypothetical protein
VEKTIDRINARGDDVKSYWDLSEQQRAALTAAQVEDFIDIELMREGVIRVRDLVLDDEPPLPEPDVTVYQLQHTSWNTRDLCFETPEDAIASCRDQIGQIDDERIGNGSDYAGPSVRVLKPIPSEQLLAKEVKLYSPSRVEQCRLELEKALTARKKNGERKAAHKEAVEKQRKALEGMWGDWHACRDKSDRLERVSATLAEYIGHTSGDREMAMTFLHKVFAAADIEAAIEWQSHKAAE